MNNQPRRFLDEDNIKLELGFKYGVNDKTVLANILGKHPKVS